MALTRLKASNILDSDYKSSCRVTTATNITLTAGAPTVVDGITLVKGDRVLVRGQNTASQNGIYKVSVLGTGSNGTWIRDIDASENNSISTGTLVYVESGTSSGGKFYYLTTTGTITIGTTSISFSDLLGSVATTAITNGNSNVSVAANSNVTVSVAGNANVITVTGTGANISGTANVTGNVDVGGNVTITGCLTVNGTTTTINSTTLTVDDLNIVLASGAATAAAANGAGISIDGASATLNYISSSNTWTFDRGITVSGTANITGNANVGNLGTATAIITTGNITTINSGLLQNGNSNVAITANSNVTINANGSPRMTITAAGNVGIGTTSPSTTLQVLRSDLQTGYAEVATIIQQVSAGNTSILGFGQVADNQSFIEARDESNNKGALLLQPYGGNVAIGASSPGHKLQVTGGYIAQQNLDGSLARISLVNTNRNWSFSNYGSAFAPNGSFHIADETAGLVRFSIGTDGNVGIGIASPTSTLHVVGTANISGNANVGNLGTATAIATTGNITTINSGLLQNGNSNVTITANGNVTVNAVGGTRFTATSTGANVTGTLGVSGNANVGNLGTTGLITATGNVSGGNLTTGGAVSATGSITGSVLVANQSAVNEGGEIQLSLPSSGSTLSTAVAIDVYQNRLRIFETGGTNRGAFIDLSAATAGVGSNLLAGGTGGLTFTASTSAPSSPSAGHQWFETDTDTLYTYVNDGTSAFWLDISSFPAQLINGNSNIAIAANSNVSISSAGNANVFVVTGTGANITGTANISSTFTARNANYTFTLPNVGAAASWIKLGTFTAPQSGSHVYIKVVTSVGYNADPVQQSEVHIHFKTSNGGSVNANGFAGESTFYVTNANGSLYNVKVVGNAAGVSATAYDIFFFQAGAYNGDASFYTVELGNQYTCTWTNSSTTAADPGVASSTIAIGSNRFLLQSNLGIGVTAATSTLHVAGTANITGNTSVGNLNLTGNIVDSGELTIQTSANGNITLNPNGTGLVVTTASLVPNANATLSLGTTSLRYANIWGLASSAQYADLAEKYQSDDNYDPGIVVVFGGEHEITVTNVSHDTRVAGVISTAPAYLMNDDETKQGIWLPVALTGRVPTKVLGPVDKGDIVVASNTPGVAVKLDKSLYEPGCIIGKSLESITTNDIKIIEVVIGRF